MRIKIDNELSHRHIDENGFLYVDRSPILKSGVLEYYGAELLEEGQEEIDGVRIEPDKVYKVYIPHEELEKGKDSFKLIPITNKHSWLGLEGENAKGKQEGSTGEEIFIEGEYLYSPLKFTNLDTIDEIMSGKKEELSSSYFNKLTKSDNPDYDFVASDIKANHLALVDKGRCGSDVRVLNNKMEFNMKTKNETKLIVGDKEVNLDQFFDEEHAEDVHDDSIVENEDKRAIIDEIGGILKDKVDEEVWRTIVGKIEKIAYEPSETSEADNEEKEEIIAENEDKEEEKAENKCSNSVDFVKMANSIKSAIEKQAKAEEASKVRAYNSARAVIGDFNAFGLSAKDMYVKALNHKGVELTGKEKDEELAAMLRVCSTLSKVDNSFSYQTSATEEIDINV